MDWTTRRFVRDWWIHGNVLQKIWKCDRKLESTNLQSTNRPVHKASCPRAD